MAENNNSLQYRRSTVVEPKTTSPFNQFLPTKDKTAGYVPVRGKRVERNEDNRRSWGDALDTEEDKTFSRSKSMSDIIAEAPKTRQADFEELQMMRSQLKENEDKWQDDLTKWKNRRRSVNCDIVKKKEEREQIEMLTSGRSTNTSKTFREMREEKESRRLGTSGSDLNPQPRTPLAHSYTVDNSYSVAPAVPDIQKRASQSGNSNSPTKNSAAPSWQKENRDVTVKSLEPAKTSAPLLLSFEKEEKQDGVTPARPSPTPVTPSPFSAWDDTNTTISTYPAHASWTSIPKEENNGSKSSTSSSHFVSKAPESKPFTGKPTEVHRTSYKDSSTEQKPGVAGISTSLPRSYQRSESQRIASVVAPRPFGSQSTKINSMPRSITMVDSVKFSSGERAQKSSGSSYYNPSKTSEDETQSSGNEEEDDEEEVNNKNGISQTTTDFGQTKVTPLKSDSESSCSEEHYSDMRIILNQSPNSSRDFGFQTSWDSTGVHVKSIQPGSPAELCHLQVGDDILSISGQPVSNMNFSEWKASMERALLQGDLVIDVRRRGNNNWDRGLHSLPFKSHKTINLASMDPRTSPSENDIKTSKDISSLSTSESSIKTAAVSNQPINVSKGLNGGFQEDPVLTTNKEFDPISVKISKRRSEFFENQGGSESAGSNVPSRCWNLEEDLKRQEKWQREQDHQLQERFKDDQRRLREEWFRDQQEAAKPDSMYYTEGNEMLDVWSCSPHSPRSPSRPDPFTAWENSRQSEEEMQKAERQRREQEEEQRQEAERKRREKEAQRRQRQQEEEERQRQKEEEERQRFLKASEEKQRKNERFQEQQQSSESSYTHSEMSFSYRGISKSTPEFDETNHSYTRASGMSDFQKGKDSQSSGELQRQQLVQQMRKTTQLNTDNSWIRQNSNIMEKEPVSLVEPIRSSASVENLDAPQPWRQSLGPTASLPIYSSLQSAALPRGYTRPGSSQQFYKSISGRKICTLCETPLGKGAAMIIESLGLCFHLSCFKCSECTSDLGGSDIGTEVRIRNKKLYCNSCYVQLKNGKLLS